MTDKHFMQAKADEQIKKKKKDDNTAETETVSFDQGPTSEAVQRALSNPSSANLTPAVVTSLQRSHGNKFVAQLSRQQNAGGRKLSAPIQMKMSVTAADDKHEHEADAVAKDVMSKINSGEVQRDREEAVQAKRIDRVGEEEEVMQGKRIDRAEEEELMAKRIDRVEEEEEAMQMKRIQREEGMEEEEAMQMKRIDRVGEEEEVMQGKRIDRAEEEELMAKRIQRGGGKEGFDVDSNIEDRIESRRGGGTPMDDNTLQNMEGAFGADFSDVRIHTDSEAADLSNSVQARAFTTGSDIYFNEGESPQNEELLAHELTHTIQQGAVAQTKRKEKDSE